MRENSWIKDATYHFPLIGRLWRKSLWFSGRKCMHAMWKNAWQCRIRFYDVREFLGKSPRQRLRFKRTLKDGYFWERLRNYVMNNSCGWYECELCSTNPNDFARDDEPEYDEYYDYEEEKTTNER